MHITFKYLHNGNEKSVWLCSCFALSIRRYCKSSCHSYRSCTVRVIFLLARNFVREKCRELGVRTDLPRSWVHQEYSLWFLCFSVLNLSSVVFTSKQSKSETCLGLMLDCLIIQIDFALAFVPTHQMKKKNCSDNVLTFRRFKNLRCPT